MWTPLLVLLNPNTTTSEVFLNPLPGSLIHLLKEFFVIAEILQNKLKQSQVYIPILQLSRWFNLYIVETIYYVWL